MMASIDVNTKVFEEVVAFVQICGAFVRLPLSDARQYVCVRNDKAEIDDALAHNAASACPTYTGLLTLLVELGILARRVGKEAHSETVITTQG